MRDEYFDWLYDLVCDGKGNYKCLCAFLHGIDFFYLIPMDENRYGDGISLRYRFGYDCDIPDYYISNEIDNRPCSVLEMMAALALRMEEDIMASNDGDRTSVWFMDMLKSLDLDKLTDDKFDEAEADNKVFKFLERKYERNGKGGLFTINDKPDKDLRNVEIWYQAMWYLNDVLKGEEDERNYGR